MSEQANNTPPNPKPKNTGSKSGKSFNFIGFMPSSHW
jgi:hypothetical protein